MISTIHSIPFTTPIPTPTPNFLLTHTFKSKESEDNDLGCPHNHVKELFIRHSLFLYTIRTTC